MIEKGKISAIQMGYIMYPTILATAILLVPAITAKTAGRDLWLSPIWASFIGLFTVYIACKLNKRFPEKTIIEYSEHILGRIIGKVLGLIYLLFFLHITGIIVREYGEFIVGTFLRNTPISVVMGSMVLVCALNVRGGVEVIGRTAQMFVPIVMFLFICLVALLIPDLKPTNMLPIMEHGLSPSLKGSLVPQGWFSEFILISFLLPYLTDRKKGMKWGMISVVGVMLTVVITNLATYLIFGELTATLVYPVMVAARFISFADFFEHLEAFVMAIWVGGTFVKISMFYYAIVSGTAQWLKLSDYRPVTLPIGFLLVLVSIWLAPSLQELVHFLGTASPFYFLTVQTLIPTLLLLIAWVKYKLSGSWRT
ncbi:GerAB/ArcD/ProY family transporter [Paenibacillus sedimenti]|uniref:Endospore germination permease n=1 Tax=Paenibacillus sedimenti TaxID=2770274 RepID=A0A926KNZ8_9BACL|nr:endospore germination permease [Paenibacillus sedimenti]MBD0379505.1 endospore germination permease [Paenibacillus sedimenti]